MYYSILFTALLASLTSLTSVVAAPLSADVALRQLGGGPGTGVGTVWHGTWADTSIKAPVDFRGVRGVDCTYEVTFKRDIRDNGKYKLSYYSSFGIGEVRSKETKVPVDLHFSGDVDSNGRKTYSATIENACSTFFNDKRAPTEFGIYFTESQSSKTNYHLRFTAG